MNYGGIYKTSIADGLGWRTVLFVSGCSHACPGCHNPESWDKNFGHPFTQETMDILIRELSKDEIDGLTLSGGDPLMVDNREDVENLVRTLKTILPEKSIWLYTGYDWDEIKDLSLLNYVDVVVDGKFILAQRDITLAFRGSTNQRIIDVQKSLKENKVVEFPLGEVSYEKKQ